jgi:hypothetical protein
MTTILSSVERVNNGTNFHISLGDFLDEFYVSNNKIRQTMIAQEPKAYPNVKKEYLCLLAATAHKLANDYGMPVPYWTMGKKYKMIDRPYFDCNARGNLRLLFMYKSPIEFKHRNLFVDENFLMRV